MACTAGCCEGFEATLRVFEFQAERQAQDQVEDSSEELTMQRLALGLGFRTQPARADGDVGTLFQRLKKFGSFLDRRGQISIAE